MRVAPVGLPGRASCDGVPESPASAPGTPTAPPIPARANRLSLAATVGAGRTRKMPAADAVTAPRIVTSRPAVMCPPPLADLHIKLRLQRPKHTHANT